MLRSTRTAALVVLLAFGAAVPAHAACPPEADQESGLTLSVSPTDDTTDRSRQRVTILECRTPAGTHPRKAEACDQLETAGGNFNSLKADPHAICAMIYAPVTATAAGTWRGKPVTWQKTYANECQLTSETGYVFEPAATEAAVRPDATV
ncbi:SSI family serine proteinase inhibitor [Streptomyces goshikiensis]